MRRRRRRTGPHRGPQLEPSTASIYPMMEPVSALRCHRCLHAPRCLPLLLMHACTQGPPTTCLFLQQSPYWYGPIPCHWEASWPPSFPASVPSSCALSQLGHLALPSSWTPNLMDVRHLLLAACAQTSSSSNCSPLHCLSLMLRLLQFPIGLTKSRRSRTPAKWGGGVLTVLPRVLEKCHHGGGGEGGDTRGWRRRHRARAGAL